MAVVIVPGTRVQLTDRHALFGKVSFPFTRLHLVEPDPATAVVHFNAYSRTSRHLLFEARLECQSLLRNGLGRGGVIRDVIPFESRISNNLSNEFVAQTHNSVKSVERKTQFLTSSIPVDQKWEEQGSTRFCRF